MNKKILLRKLGGIFGSFFLVMNSYATSIGTVNVPVLNVRSGPSTQYKVIKQIKKGDEVHIKDIEKDWYSIDINGQKAYVHSDYVNVISDTGEVKVNRLNFREQPSLNSKIITQLNKGDIVSIIAVTGKWYHVKYNNKIGYLYNDYVQIDNNKTSNKKANNSNDLQKTNSKLAVVKADILNIRRQPTTSSSKIGKTYYGKVLDVIEVTGKWVHIKTANNTVGYVHGDYVTIKNSSDIPIVSSATSTSNLGNQIVNYAKKFLGTRYVWGGNSLTKGVDCSGFTQQVMKHFGVYINRTSYNQVRNGKRISKSQLQPGDLVFYGYNGRISHVAIYIGNNKIINAKDAHSGVVIGNLNRTRGKRYIVAVRVVK